MNIDPRMSMTPNAQAFDSAEGSYFTTTPVYQKFLPRIPVDPRMMDQRLQLQPINSNPLMHNEPLTMKNVQNTFPNLKPPMKYKPLGPKEEDKFENLPELLEIKDLGLQMDLGRLNPSEMDSSEADQRDIDPDIMHTYGIDHQGIDPIKYQPREATFNPSTQEENKDYDPHKDTLPSSLQGFKDDFPDNIENIAELEVTEKPQNYAQPQNQEIFGPNNDQELALALDRIAELDSELYKARQEKYEDHQRMSEQQEKQKQEFDQHFEDFKAREQQLINAVEQLEQEKDQYLDDIKTLSDSNTKYLNQNQQFIEENTELLEKKKTLQHTNEDLQSMVNDLQAQLSQ